MKILIINGPNLNNLGNRDASHYGSESYKDIVQSVRDQAAILGVDVSFFQSNSEGELVTFIQNESKICDGIVINAGAITHYGLSLKDCLLDAKIPLVEIHISNIHKREEYRRNSVIESVAVGQVAGFGTQGYIYALELMVNHLKNGI